MPCWQSGFIPSLTGKAFGFNFLTTAGSDNFFYSFNFQRQIP